jgi:hypothetical protein
MQSACAVLYCHLCPVRLYNIFPHYLINGTILGKNVIEYKMSVLISSKRFVSNIFNFKNNSARFFFSFVMKGLRTTALSLFVQPQ